MENGDRISIEKDDRGYTVRSGDRWEDHLDAGEALWCVVSIMTGKGTAFLQTKEQHDAWNAKYRVKPPLEPWQKQLSGGDQNVNECSSALRSAQ
jgi:hypothetical protein